MLIKIRNNNFIFFNIILFSILGAINYYLVSIDMFTKLLGGSAILFYAAPLLMLVMYKFKTYRKNILLLIIILVGFILLNLLVFFLKNSRWEIHIIFIILISSLPFLIILCTYLDLINLSFKPEDELDNQKYKETIKNLKIINAIIGFTLLTLGEFLFVLSINKKILALNETLNIVYIILGCLIFGVFSMIFLWKKLRNTENIFIIKNFERIQWQNKNIKKYKIVAVFLFTVFLFGFEIERGMWVFLIMWSLLLVLMFIHLWEFYKRIFIESTQIKCTTSFTLPEMYSSKMFAIYILGFTVLFLLLFIVRQLVLK